MQYILSTQLHKITENLQMPQGYTLHDLEI